MYNSGMNEILDRASLAKDADPIELVTTLIHTGKVIEERLDDTLAAVGLSVAKWAAIHQLALAEEPLTLSQLADRLACVRSNATQLVDRLEADKLVRRAPDPEDRRSIRAQLTPEGRRRYQAGRDAVQLFARELLGRYAAKEQALLSELLVRLDKPSA